MRPDPESHRRVGRALCDLAGSGTDARVDALSCADGARFWTAANWKITARGVPQHDMASFIEGVVIAEEELGWLPGSQSASVVVRLVLGEQAELGCSSWNRSGNPYTRGLVEQPWSSYGQAVVEIEEEGKQSLYPGARRRGDIWVVTASNPGAQRLTDAENEQRRQRLVFLASGAGASCTPAVGRDHAGTWAEQSVALLRASRPLAVALGSLFQQDAVFEVGSSGIPEVIPCRPLLAPASSPLSFLLAHAASAPWCTKVGCTTCGAADFRWAVHALAHGIPIAAVLLRDDRYAALRERGGAVPRSPISGEARERLLGFIESTPDSAWEWRGLESPRGLVLAQ